MLPICGQILRIYCEYTIVFLVNSKVNDFFTEKKASLSNVFDVCRSLQNNYHDILYTSV